MIQYRNNKLIFKHFYYSYKNYTSCKYNLNNPKKQVNKIYLPNFLLS